MLPFVDPAKFMSTVEREGEVISHDQHDPFPPYTPFVLSIFILWTFYLKQLRDDNRYTPFVLSIFILWSFIALGLIGWSVHDLIVHAGDPYFLPLIFGRFLFVNVLCLVPSLTSLALLIKQKREQYERFRRRRLLLLVDKYGLTTFDQLTIFMPITYSSLIPFLHSLGATDDFGGVIDWKNEVVRAAWLQRFASDCPLCGRNIIITGPGKVACGSCEYRAEV